MAHRIKMPPDSPALWPLEAQSFELEEYVSSRILPARADDVSTEDAPIEPAWFREAFDASWPRVLAEADLW